MFQKFFRNSAMVGWHFLKFNFCWKNLNKFIRNLSIRISSRRNTRTVRDNGTNNVSPKATVIWKWKDWPETKGLGRRWGRYTATTPTAWEATTSVRRPRSLLLVRRFFAVRSFRFSHCVAFIISSPGRGLSFSLCCLSPSPFFVDYVPFSTEYRSFRSASSKKIYK